MGRKQMVGIAGKFSGMTNVTSGIPQGSILGPVLFTIFINDLPDAINVHCKVFADDIKIYDSSKNTRKYEKIYTKCKNGIYILM